TTGKEAHGFVLEAVANGAQANVYFEGTNTQVTGQTPGPVTWVFVPSKYTLACAPFATASSTKP
ncbi:MAG: hypothetical protein EOO27_46505, partial [Comamonadaceae bacterium]